MKWGGGDGKFRRNSGIGRRVSVNLIMGRSWGGNGWDGEGGDVGDEVREGVGLGGIEY